MVTFQLFCLGLIVLSLVVGLVISLVRVGWPLWWRMVWGVGWRTVVVLAGIALFFVVLLGALGLLW